jgi:hypothetical protein
MTTRKHLGCGLGLLVGMTLLSLASGPPRVLAAPKPLKCVTDYGQCPTCPIYSLDASYAVVCFQPSPNKFPACKEINPSPGCDGNVPKKKCEGNKYQFPANWDFAKGNPNNTAGCTDFNSPVEVKINPNAKDLQETCYTESGTCK